MAVNKKMVFVAGSAGLIMGLAGFLLLNEMRRSCVGREIRRKRDMSISNRILDQQAKRIAEESCPDKCNGISDREKKEIRERIKAMSPEELAIVVDCIPVGLCMARINSELTRAAEFERSVKEACGMK